jgi:hypothetical protein
MPQPAASGRADSRLRDLSPGCSADSATSRVRSVAEPARVLLSS